MGTEKPAEYPCMFADLGIYECPTCTVFGIEREEAKTLMTLCGAGLKFTDRNKEAEGFEVNTSAFKARLPSPQRASLFKSIAASFT